jgi:hypothetical protein
MCVSMHVTAAGKEKRLAMNMFNKGQVPQLLRKRAPSKHQQPPPAGNHTC